MKEFLESVEEFVTFWSKDRNKNFITTKKFLEIPPIETHLWTLAFEWCKLNKRIIKLSRNDHVLYMFTSSEVSFEASKSMCKELLDKTHWNSFDDYKSQVTSIRYVKLDELRWESSVCSCVYWNKNYICKHTIGVAFNCKLTSFPGLDLNIEANARRGRRKKATEALVHRDSTGPVNPLMMTQNEIESQPEVDLQVSTAQGIISHALGGSSITIEKIHTNTSNKKRGRPRKNIQISATSIEENEITSDQPTTSAQALLKKRGRPPKSNHNTDNEISENAKKRKLNN